MSSKYETDAKHYEAIARYFLFGTKPDGEHIIIRCLGRNAYHEQYTIVDWPECLKDSGIDMEDVAIACSQGYMPFGYTCLGPMVCIYMD